MLQILEIVSFSKTFLKVSLSGCNILKEFSFLRTRAEHIAKVDELVASKKVEVNSLQDQCSEKDRQILDMEAQVSDLNNRLSALSNR